VGSRSGIADEDTAPDASHGPLNLDARQEYRHRDAGHVLPGVQRWRALAGCPALVNEVPEATGERRNLDVIAVIGDGLALR